MIPASTPISLIKIRPHSEDWLVSKLAKHFGEDTEVTYFPSMGDTLPSIRIKSTRGNTDIDLAGDTEKELQKELNSILNIFRNRIRPKSIKLQDTRQSRLYSSYDKTANNCLINALHQQS